jgi:hypothetical protein
MVTINSIIITAVFFNCHFQFLKYNMVTYIIICNIVNIIWVKVNLLSSSTLIIIAYNYLQSPMSVRAAHVSMVALVRMELTCTLVNVGMVTLENGVKQVSNVYAIGCYITLY